jgi:hypothetical protein
MTRQADRIEENFQKNRVGNRVFLQKINKKIKAKKSHLNFGFFYQKFLTKNSKLFILVDCILSLFKSAKKL